MSRLLRCAHRQVRSCTVLISPLLCACYKETLIRLNILHNPLSVLPIKLMHATGKIPTRLKNFSAAGQVYMKTLCNKMQNWITLHPLYRRSNHQSIGFNSDSTHFWPFRSCTENLQIDDNYENIKYYSPK